ncbi:MAG: NAD(P)H-hydrate epimerase [Pseudomonadota bacterium]
MTRGSGISGGNAEAAASGFATEVALMDRAAAGTIAALCDRWPECAEAPGRAVIFCGPGWTGGVGLALARLLHDTGWSLTVFQAGPPAPGASVLNHRRWLARGDVAPLMARQVAPLRDDPGFALAVNAQGQTSKDHVAADFGGVQALLRHWQSAPRAVAPRVVALGPCLAAAAQFTVTLAGDADGAAAVAVDLELEPGIRAEAKPPDPP